LNDVRTRAGTLVRDVSPEQLLRRPDPAKWSIAECLAHLNKTAAIVQPKIAAAIEQGTRDKVFGKGPFSPGALGRLLIWIAEPPPKFRFPAPKEIVPQVDGGDPAAIIAEFMRVQDEWERLIRACDGLDQKKVKVASPFLRIPPVRLAGFIPWMIAHQRRHLVQAEGVKSQLQAKAAGA
jgi:hypothetical protein